MHACKQRLQGAERQFLAAFWPLIWALMTSLWFSERSFPRGVNGKTNKQKRRGNIRKRHRYLSLASTHVYLCMCSCILTSIMHTRVRAREHTHTHYIHKKNSMFKAKADANNLSDWYIAFTDVTFIGYLLDACCCLLLSQKIQSKPIFVL